jgi:hypothetical protein
MSLESLANTPPWEWPRNAGDLLLQTLQARQAAADDRLLAAELAGDITVVNDRITDALLDIVNHPAEPAEMRSTAAIALGPALEYADTMGFDDADDLLVTPAALQRIQEALQRLHGDAEAPKDLRRAALEASVRAPLNWHAEAIDQAYSGGDAAWRLTAVFCMRYIEGFDAQIIEALSSADPDLRYEAVCAAGNWGVDAAWPHVAALLTSQSVDKDLLLAAIDASVGIRPQDAMEHLVALADADDEDIAEAAQEAMVVAETPLDDEDLEDQEDEDR